MLRRVSFFVPFVAFVVFVACDRTETSSRPVTSTTPAGASIAPSPAAAKHRDEALVRVVHAVPNGTQLDLFAGDLELFDGLGFKAVTPYRAVDGQRYAFALRPAGMARAKPLSSNTEGLQDGSFYTAFAMPGDGRTPNLRVVTDHLAPPAAGKAQLRVVHAGLDAGTIDVREAVSNNVLFHDVAYQTVSDYHEVTPVNGAIEIAGGDKALASFTVHLEPGRFYTIVIVGNANGTPRLEAFLIEDALAP